MKNSVRIAFLFTAVWIGLWACKDTPPGADELDQQQQQQQTQQGDNSSPEDDPGGEESPDENDDILPDLSPLNGMIILGENDTILLTGGTLTNLESENFESGGQSWYCYQLKLERWYPGTLPNAYTYLSYSINFKFFSNQEYSAGDEEFRVEYLGSILSYYQAINQNYAFENKTIAYLQGDRLCDPRPVYRDYLTSQVRINSGILQIKKSGSVYQVSFVGHTDEGESVVCNFNDALSLQKDNYFESNEDDFSSTVIPENYIQKNGKYFKLEDGQVYFPYNSQANTFRVMLYSAHNYYRYEDSNGVVSQTGKQNAVIIQFQFEDLNQFQSGVYKIVPSEVNTGYDYQFLPAEQVASFPNDSLCIGFYHLAATEGIEWMSLGYSSGFTDYFVLQSGELTITPTDKGLDVTGNFIDSDGVAVTVKFQLLVDLNFLTP